MAKMLDTTSNAEIEAVAAEERKNQVFKFIKIGSVLTMIGIIVFTIISVVTTMNKIEKQTATYNELETIRADLDAKHQELIGDTSLEDGSTSSNEVTLNMLSASENGERVCELQEILFTKGYLSESDGKNELITLTGESNNKWLQLSQNVTPVIGIDWRFLTPYDIIDGPDAAYKVFFGCYDASGEYLLCVVQAIYSGDAETGEGSFSNFKIMTTDIGKIYCNYGYIETNPDIESEVSPETQEVLNTADQLIDYMNEQDTIAEDATDDDTTQSANEDTTENIETTTESSDVPTDGGAL